MMDDEFGVVSQTITISGYFKSGIGISWNVLSCNPVTCKYNMHKN